MKYRIGAAALAAFFVLAFVPVTVSAEEDAEEQLEQVEESSQEAVVAPSEEEAKDLSGQGFDTPSTDE
ncbi:MAG: hypothetical protein RH982_09065 [Parvibaculum sp.]